MSVMNKKKASKMMRIKHKTSYKKRILELRRNTSLRRRILAKMLKNSNNSGSFSIGFMVSLELTARFGRLPHDVSS